MSCLLSGWSCVSGGKRIGHSIFTVARAAQMLALNALNLGVVFSCRSQADPATAAASACGKGCPEITPPLCWGWKGKKKA